MTDSDSQNLYDDLVGKPLTDIEREEVAANLLGFMNLLIDIDRSITND